MSENSDPRDLIYVQDCEFYRFQDQLRWGRFKTAATIEAGFLYALYALHRLTVFETRLFMIVGFLLVLLVCVLAWKDGLDAERHLERIKDFEKCLPLSDSSWFGFARGRNMMLLASVLLNLFNFVLILYRWC